QSSFEIVTFYAKAVHPAWQLAVGTVFLKNKSRLVMRVMRGAGVPLALISASFDLQIVSFQIASEVNFNEWDWTLNQAVVKQVSDLFVGSEVERRNRAGELNLLSRDELNRLAKEGAFQQEPQLSSRDLT